MNSQLGHSNSVAVENNINLKEIKKWYRGLFHHWINGSSFLHPLLELVLFHEGQIQNDTSRVCPLIRIQDPCSRLTLSCQDARRRSPLRIQQNRNNSDNNINNINISADTPDNAHASSVADQDRNRDQSLAKKSLAQSSLYVSAFVLSCQTVRTVRDS